jgi:hypothetical protein
MAIVSESKKREMIKALACNKSQILTSQWSAKLINFTFYCDLLAARKRAGNILTMLIYNSLTHIAMCVINLWSFMESMICLDSAKNQLPGTFACTGWQGESESLSKTIYRSRPQMK